MAACPDRVMPCVNNSATRTKGLSPMVTTKVPFARDAAQGHGNVVNYGCQCGVVIDTGAPKRKTMSSERSPRAAHWCSPTLKQRALL
jgi:hypothetical protein